MYQFQLEPTNEIQKHEQKSPGNRYDREYYPKQHVNDKKLRDEMQNPPSELKRNLETETITLSEFLWKKGHCRENVRFRI